MNIDIGHIQLLRQLIRSDMVLSRAAKVLKLSQPSASRKIKELEEAVGLKLINRKGKRFDGLTFFATRILNDIDSIDTALINIQNLAFEQSAIDQDSMTVATTHAQARYFLPSIIGRFQAKWPKVEFKIHQTMPSDIAKLVSNGVVDIAMCTENIASDPNLDFELGYSWEHCICIPKGHELSSGYLDMKRISEYPILTYVNGISERKALEAAFNNKGISLNIVIAAADTDVLKNFVRMGLGCALIGSMCYDPVQDKDLLIRPVRDFPNFQVATAWKKGKYLPPFVRAFKKMVIHESPYYESKIGQNLYAFGDKSGKFS